MSEEKQKENPTQATSDELKPAGELVEKDLGKVSGGVGTAYLKIDGVDGESTDNSYKGYIELL